MLNQAIEHERALQKSLLENALLETRLLDEAKTIRLLEKDLEGLKTEIQFLDFVILVESIGLLVLLGFLVLAICL